MPTEATFSFKQQKELIKRSLVGINNYINYPHKKPNSENLNLYHSLHTLLQQIITLGDGDLENIDKLAEYSLNIEIPDFKNNFSNLEIGSNIASMSQAIENLLFYLALISAVNILSRTKRT